ncbi:MAG: hypothetical protein AB2L07_18725 [Thermoanaerobaculaceae bacterium]
MSEPVAIGLVLAGATLMVALLLAGIDSRWRVYAKAASILGLAKDRSAIIGPAIKGTHRGWAVSVWEASSEPPRTKLAVTSPSRIPSHLCLRPARGGPVHA